MTLIVAPINGRSVDRGPATVETIVVGFIKAGPEVQVWACCEVSDINVREVVERHFPGQFDVIQFGIPGAHGREKTGDPESALALIVKKGLRVDGVRHKPGTTKNGKVRRRGLLRANVEGYPIVAIHSPKRDTGKRRRYWLIARRTPGIKVGDWNGPRRAVVAMFQALCRVYSEPGEVVHVMVPKRFNSRLVRVIEERNMPGGPDHGAPVVEVGRRR